MKTWCIPGRGLPDLLILDPQFVLPYSSLAGELDHWLENPALCPIAGEMCAALAPDPGLLKRRLAEAFRRGDLFAIPGSLVFGGPPLSNGGASRKENGKDKEKKNDSEKEPAEAQAAPEGSPQAPDAGGYGATLSVGLAKTWRMPGPRWGDLLVVSRLAARWSIPLSAQVTQWLDDPVLARAAVDMYQSLGGCRAVRGGYWTVADLRRLGPRLLSAFQRGELVAIPVGGPGRQSAVGEGDKAQSPGGSQQPADSDSALAALRNASDTAAASDESKATTKTWVEIELRDPAGKPVANEKYRLTLPDGSVREGTLGADGRARADDIDPGTCQVSFPGLDAREWRAA